jgi:hypothetical protein
MKKLIFPAVLLALLSGCGIITGTNDNKDLDSVSGTANGTTTDLQTYETEATTDQMSTSNVTTSKSAGKKISGTTTAVHTTNNIIVSATKAPNNDGVVHGTTRSVPTVHRTTTSASPSTTTTEESTTQTASFDPKDYSSISFSLGTKPNEIKVSRKNKNGEETTFQQIKDVDTTDIEKELKHDDEKKLEDFIVNADFDGDSYPDVFIIEKQDELENKTGKYYRYDPENGIYVSWKEMNVLKNLVELDDLKNGKMIVFDKKDEIEYELKTYEWNGDSKLILRSTAHQYKTDDIYITYTDYDDEGDVTKSYTTNLAGEIIDNNQPTTEPITDPTEPTSVDQEEK